MATVVSFHAHPDDEVILSGGTLARLAAEGHRVVLVVATRGELGEVPAGLLAPGQKLEDRRVAETQWAADVLGIARVEFLPYRDSGMAGERTNDDPDAFCNADIDEAASRLGAIVADERAAVLTGYDERGGYGHPDHVQVHRVAVAAADRCGLALYEVTLNRDRTRRGLEALEQTAGPGDIRGPQLPDDFGTPESEITHAVDVHAFLVDKRRAMSAHSSQIGETSFFLSLGDTAFAAGFGKEWYVKRRSGPRGATVLDDLNALKLAAARGMADELAP